MIIKTMKASFGTLQNQTLELRDGLNIIEAPNEAGKSTWGAFLRAMLYGIDTKDRDKKGYLADKNRYQPWSGAPMEGELRILWQGNDITLRRFAKGSTPFGGFSAVYTVSGEPVPFLTGENAGETLLGVGLEVYRRSAFVGQGSGVPISGTAELEKRIAALVSSGEEDVSYSETEKRLKTWLNRRKHNKTGLIPQLDEELARLNATLSRMDALHEQGEDTRRTLDALDREKAALTAQLERHRLFDAWACKQRYDGAQDGLRAAQDEVDAIRGEQRKYGVLPERSLLKQAQGELQSLSTLSASISQAQDNADRTRQALEQEALAARDDRFPTMTAEDALHAVQAAQRTLSATSAGTKKAGTIALVCSLLALGLGLGLAAALLLLTQRLVLAVGSGCGLFGTITLAASLWKGAQLQRNADERSAVLKQYGVAEPEALTPAAEEYAQRYCAAEQAERAARAAATALATLEEQKRAVWEQLLAFVRLFAPEVTDEFGVSAALSRALTLEEKLSTAQVRLEGARQLADAVTAAGLPDSALIPPAPGETRPVRAKEDLSARLGDVERDLSRLRGTLALTQGELNSLGDEAALAALREETESALAARQEEYNALLLALDALAAANTQLQARFSPELNRRAGELFTALTGGHYHQVSLTREFEAAATEKNGLLPRSALALSQGATDQLYLAVRLAVCDLALPKTDSSPLLLDDTLAFFDNKRMALALDELQRYAERRQVLLLTCHTREAAYLQGVPGVHTVVLNAAN